LVRFGDIVSSAFEKAIFSGGNLRDVIDGLAQDLARLVLRQQLLNPIAKAMGGAMGDATGGATIFDMIFKKRAHGGAVGREPVWVGEQGRELFVPNAPGNIVPAHKIGSDGGRVEIHNHMNLSGGASVNEVYAIVERGKVETLRALQSMRRNRGALA
jgi:phage-related minor tail protein